MPQMFEQFELSVCAFGQNGRAKRLHDLFDSDSLIGELIFGRAASISTDVGHMIWIALPDQTKGTHADWLQISVSRRMSGPRFSR